MERPFPAYKGGEPYIFVSYAHEDDAIVYPELQWLKDQGFNIWYDEGISPGHEWRDELAAHIDESSLFLIFVTPQSVESEHCKREVHYAIDGHKALLIVHLEKTELHSGLGMSLSSLQAVKRHELSDREYRSRLLKGARDHIERGVALAATPPSARPANGSNLIAIAGIATVVVLSVSLAITVLDTLTPQPPDNVSEGGAPPRREGTLPDPTIPREVRSNWIAVLPFRAVSGDDEMRQLSEGLTIQAIKSLTPLHGFAIVPYRNVTRFAEREVDSYEIARALGVRYLLDGSVQLAGDRIRVVLELVDGIDGRSLWQESKTFPDGDLFAVQDEVKRIVVRELSSRMDAIERERLRGVDWLDMSPSELVLIADKYFISPTQDSLDAAIQYTKRGVELEPENAAALSHLAEFIQQNIFLGEEEDPARARDESCQLAERALMAAGDDQMDLLNAAFALSEGCGQGARALEIALRARDMNNQHALAWAAYGNLLMKNERYTEVLAAIDHANTLDPDAFWMLYTEGWYRTMVHFHQGDWATGIPFARNALDANPANVSLRIAFANALGMIGEYENARQEWRIVSEAFPTASVARCKWYYAQSMSQDRADLLVQGLIAAAVEQMQPLGLD